MGKPSRDKGKRGECTAKHLLTDRDFTILADTSAGLSTDDLVVQDEHGKVMSVEVKNCRIINLPKFLAQARENAKKKPWMLLCKIHGTSSWLVMRKGNVPVIWHEKG